MTFPLNKLLCWFEEHKRELPWRENRSFYRVWISEVMLQQTQVTTVIFYFQRWMEHFPTLEALAQAPIEAVIKLWEGLGYYSRARNLHKGARYILEHFKGNIALDETVLLSIPGIGAYTAAAILAFAYDKPAAPVDANVLRVISRFLALEESVEKASVKKTIKDFVLQQKINGEALIELGALVCKKKPLCFSCPLVSHCLSYKLGLQEVIPQKKEKPKVITLNRVVALVEYESHWLLKKGKEGKLMADLYEFPYIEFVPETPLPEIQALLERALDIPLQFVKKLSQESHSFTHYRAHLFPYHFHALKKGEGVWKKKEELSRLPFSSGHKRIIDQLA